MANGDAQDTIRTVARGLHILRAFRASRDPLSNAELVRRTGASKAAVSRLTSTLLQLGFLRHARGGRLFELSTGPLAIGHAYLHGNLLQERAEPLMQALADRVHASVALAIGDGLEMVYVGYRASRRIATLRLGVGSVLPMGSTSIGRAWLWSLPPPRRKTLVVALRAQAGAQGATLEREIRAAFAELDATGVCAVFGGFQRDVYGVAAPLRVGREAVPMALNCGAAGLTGPELAAAGRRIAGPLRDAARALEAALADLDGVQ